MESGEECDSLEEKIEYMSHQFKKENFAFSDEQKRKFLLLYEMLVEKNKVMNLTGITKFPEVVEKHFLDSILLNRVADLNKPIKVIDVGTGAGFPGLPLKIAFPNLKIMLWNWKILRRYMPERRSLPGIRSIVKILTFPSPVQWQTFPPFRNIVFPL